MAIQTQIANWIGTNASLLDLRVVQLGWVDVWLPGFTAVDATVTLGARTSRGRGVDRNPDLALTKAVVEAIERTIKNETGLPNTSGMAGHLDAKQAGRRALFELVERDAFFCHYLTRTPFRSARDLGGVLAGDMDLHRVARLAGEAGIRLRLANLVVPADMSAVICAAFGSAAESPFGVIVGLGCDEQPSAATNQAVIECLGNVAARLHGQLDQPMSDSTFADHSAPGVFEHLKLGLDLQSGLVMEQLFQPTPALGPQPKAIPLDDLSMTSLPLPELIMGAPLAFVRISSVNAQCAYFGHLTPDLLNFSRLQAFSGRPIAFSDVESFPHPLA